YNSTYSSFDSDDIAHLVHDIACVYFDGSSSDVNNVGVIDCKFTRTVSGERCPFILAKGVDDGYISNVKIIGNEFTPGANDGLNSSIAIFGESGAAGDFPVYITNADICNNTIHGKGSILCVPINYGVGDVNYRRLVAKNLSVKDNLIKDGLIGITCSGSSEF